MPIIGVVNELNTITSIVKAMTLYQVTVKFFKSSYDCFTNSLNFMIQSLLFYKSLDCQIKLDKFIIFDETHKYFQWCSIT
ncbi:Hypothetical protein SA1_54188 [Staphylococcus aureus subsp. aureus PSP1996]|uniref:Uncharacterized protein n=1 Tax=Staphylococcus aureus (strain NCTC 8325 / PS 47) TaxID=93061 RepID=Q2FUR0_STAA8|nr:hypothetical protein SAOUHSC_03043 [Staphylococcus aureus subsp. aureus NCTC 8325]EFG39794.1 hypothetical protein SKAG_01905 [Staphylococcus aureus A9754]EFU28240.1 hypothetical protein CGSSa01_15070 [Staphylococcus aureus subsp. aureus CGS01]ESR29141.1 Hypothetical protein SA1_54188 [Staphylococcus aureus subsp. aureus PSP1996]